MRIGYVKELDAPVTIMDKVRYHIFSEIEIEKFEGNFIIRIPICEKNEERKTQKVIKKLLYQMQKYKIDSLAFSEKLSLEKQDKQAFCQKLQSYLLELKKQKTSLRIYPLKLISEKSLMSYMPFFILKRLLEIQQKEIREEEVYFLIKKDLKMDFSFLDPFIKTCKTVNIVTNDIERFQKIQQDLYEQENILMGVSNNRNKFLRKAKYIFNINLEAKDLKKLKIHRNAIIIHIKQDEKYEENGFQGININHIKITMPDEYTEKLDKMNALEGDKIVAEKFYTSILLERLEKQKEKSLVKKESYIQESYFEIVNQMIEKDEITIQDFIGNNGLIQKNEIIENGKKAYETPKKLYEKEKSIS